MPKEPSLPAAGKSREATAQPRVRISNQAQTLKRTPAVADFRLTTHQLDDEISQRQAELFYLQKQIQSQTPMVLVLEDGERIEGCIEWFDRKVLKVRGRQKTLIYKSAIKYMYKQGDVGQ